MSFWQRHETESTSWKRVILWWELRRIPYNLGVVGFAIVLSLVQDLIIKGGGGGSPLVLIMMFLGAMLVANLFYTSGWILDLIFRKNDRPFVIFWRSRLFVVLLLVTFALMFIFNLILVIYALSAGNLELS